ncbi:hypothetical protein DM02DRAFT_310907 [Periconia macrospinosa]|uniref:Uncharacterized protein n=1 Tax=Periconia macrospinosa TaxID=97972 RepID=A0A2V1DVL0_9PLEO|nr:hypothetical protein DM02DRAFT_310907 [Periconia macrospinosa]
MWASSDRFGSICHSSAYICLTKTINDRPEGCHPSQCPTVLMQPCLFWKRTSHQTAAGSSLSPVAARSSVPVDCHLTKACLASSNNPQSMRGILIPSPCLLPLHVHPCACAPAFEKPIEHPNPSDRARLKAGKFLINQPSHQKCLRGNIAC